MILRFISLLRLVDSPFFPPDDSDGKYYVDWANRIAGGVWTDGKSFYGLPLYPYLLALFLALFQGNLAIPLIFQAITDAAVAAMITEFSFFIIERTKYQFRISDSSFTIGNSTLATTMAVLAGLGWSLYQPAQAYSISYIPAVYGTLAFWLVARLAVAWNEFPSFGRLFLLGLAMGVAAMMVANLLLLVPLLLVRLWLLRDRASGRWMPLPAAACLGLGIVAGTSPAWIHNYFVAREPVMLSSHAGVNFFVGNQPGATGYPKMPPGVRASQAGMLEDSQAVAEAALQRKLTRAEASRYWSERAWQAIRADPGAWFMLLGTKARNYWNAFQYDDISMITALRDEGVTFPGPRFGWVALLGIPGLVLGARFLPRARWIAAAVALHFLSLAPVFVTERYRLVVVPGLLIGLGAGLWVLATLVRARRWLPALAWYAIPLAVAAAVVTLPVRDERLYSLDLANTAKTLLEHQRVDEAGALAQRAYAFNPGGAEINFLLGNYWLAKGDRNQAKKFYWQTLNLDPKHARAWNNSGVMAIEEKQWTPAVHFLTRAVALNPADAKTRYLLARALQGTGDAKAALDMVDSAIALDSKQPQFRALQTELRGQADSAAPPP